MYTLQNSSNQRGFTIVELLIVVVVIAILAAITIVSYVGITSRANAATSRSTASNLQKKVETYIADSSAGAYPLTLGVLTATGNSWTTPVMWANGGSLATTNTAVSGSTPANQVQYFVCGRTNTAGTAPTTPGGITGVTGMVIAYWNHTASPAATAYFSSGAGMPASITTQSNTGGTGFNSSITGGTAVVSGTTYNTACFAPNA